MKISNRNYPILEKLNNNSLGVIPIFEKDHWFFETGGMDMLVKYWKLYCNEFKSSVTYISRPFIGAAEKSEKKLWDLYGDIAKNDLADYIVKGTFLMINQVVMVYHGFKKGSDAIETAMFVFTNTGTPLLFYVESPKYDINPVAWMSVALAEYHELPVKITTPTNESFNKGMKVVYFWLMKVVLIDMFKSYAQVETKYLEPHSKQKDIGCKYINDTKLPITYLDSKWFTNLVKSDAFNVRGHFRLQPKKKDGKWTRELIWINDFIKTGYTSKAKILNQ